MKLKQLVSCVLSCTMLFAPANGQVFAAQKVRQFAGLKKDAKYKVRIRAVYKANGESTYGELSKTKSFKIR